MGNSTVQQTDINWSKRILGKDALTQIKIKISVDVLIAKFKLDQALLTNKVSKKALNISFSI
jgi:hypothetical protein